MFVRNVDAFRLKGRGTQDLKVQVKQGEVEDRHDVTVTLEPIAYGYRVFTESGHKVEALTEIAALVKLDAMLTAEKVS